MTTRHASCDHPTTASARKRCRAAQDGGVPRDLVEEKRCSKCGEVKPRGEFSGHAGRSDGLRPDCRLCQGARNKVRREVDREHLKTHGVPRNQVESKLCPTCGVVKDRAEFFVSASKADGLSSRCKSCQVANLRSRRKVNPGTKKTVDQRRRARKLDADCGCVDAAALSLVVEAYGNACVYCQGPVEHIDHLVPLAGGGRHCVSNLRPACGGCNTSKGASDLDDWLARRPDLSGDLAREVRVTCDLIAV